MRCEQMLKSAGGFPPHQCRHTGSYILDQRHFCLTHYRIAAKAAGILIPKLKPLRTVKPKTKTTKGWRTVRILVRVSVRGPITRQRVVKAAKQHLTGTTYHFLYGIPSAHEVGNVRIQDYDKVLNGWRRAKRGTMGHRLP
jgi:hypothetical protein